MEIKKNPNADNERYRVPLVFLGFFIIGSIITLAFTYKTPANISSNQLQQQDKDKIPKTFKVIEKKPDPPEVVEQQPIEQLESTPDLNKDIKEVKNKDKDVQINVKVEDVDVAPAPKPAKAPIVNYPDKEASFPGGAAAMKKWLATHIQYPDIARQLGDQGIVYISFVVNKDGSIEDVKILRGVSKEIDAEAKKVVKNMPKWTPGETGGESVRTRCRIPISFVLQ